jgi:hypothetical protein
MVYRLEQLSTYDKGDLIRYQYKQNPLVNFLGFRQSTNRAGYFVDFKARNRIKRYTNDVARDIAVGYVRFADMKANSTMCCSDIDKKNGFHHIRKIPLERLVEIQLLKKK